jgi:phosphoglycolate phosphatase-like HAD superfamily hydrolase
MSTPVYVFDIDGTLADCSHRLPHIQKEPKDWRSFFAACKYDKPINHLIKLANDLLRSNATIIFVSGRSDECMMETVKWLHQNIRELSPRISEAPRPLFRLYMRKAGDHRPDDIVKLELLAEIRANGYEPIMAFDDRDRVVKAWRSAGIPCAQVAEGDF